MGQISGSGFCEHCNAHVMTTKNRPNHAAHILATVFLCGLWLPVWIFITLVPQPARCNRCGTNLSGRSHGQIVGVLIGCVLLLPMIGLALSSAVTRFKDAKEIVAQEAETPLPTVRAKPSASRPAASARTAPAASPSVTAVAVPIASAPRAASVVVIEPAPPAAPVKPWQVSRSWLIDGKLIEGSLKTWSPSKVVLVRADGTEITTTRDAFSEADQAWVAEASKPK